LDEEYVQQDVELIELVKSFIPEYYDGSNNLLLVQDILFQMLDQNLEGNEVNVKQAFTKWIIANVSGGNYFVNQFGSEKERLNEELNSYEEKYKSEFNTELFIVKDENYDKLIDEVSSNIYNTSTSFNNFCEHFLGPTTIL
jgi:5-methylcytosine-specific restriction protein B